MKQLLKYLASKALHTLTTILAYVVYQLFRVVMYGYLWLSDAWKEIKSIGH